MDSRGRRRMARSAQIIEAARALIEAEGPEGLTLARLAGALDYTVGAVYRYFPGKSAIVAEVELRMVAELGQAIERSLEAFDAELRASRLNARRKSLVPALGLARTYATLPGTHPRAFAMLSLGLAREGRAVSDEDDARVMHALQPLLLRVEEILREARATGVIRAGDDARRAMQLWAAIHGATQLRKLEPIDPRFAPDTELSLTTTETLLQGFGAPPRAIEAARRFIDRETNPQGDKA